jgi:hypothetical protein
LALCRFEASLRSLIMRVFKFALLENHQLKASQSQEGRFPEASFLSAEAEKAAEHKINIVRFLEN